MTHNVQGLAEIRTTNDVFHRSMYVGKSINYKALMTAVRRFLNDLEDGRQNLMHNHDTCCLLSQDLLMCFLSITELIKLLFN